MPNKFFDSGKVIENPQAIRGYFDWFASWGVLIAVLSIFLLILLFSAFIRTKGNRESKKGILAMFAFGAVMLGGGIAQFSMHTNNSYNFVEKAQSHNNSLVSISESVSEWKTYDLKNKNVTVDFSSKGRDLMVEYEDEQIPNENIKLKQ